MRSKISKSPSKSTLHWEGAGVKQKNSCKRCNGTGKIETWYDTSETRKVTTDCPVCPPAAIDLQALRESGL
jgi:DnaJ-class molecular chaperone